MGYTSGRVESLNGALRPRSRRFSPQGPLLLTRSRGFSLEDEYGASKPRCEFKMAVKMLPACSEITFGMGTSLGLFPSSSPPRLSP